VYREIGLLDDTVPEREIRSNSDPDSKDGICFDIREQTSGVIENIRDILASCDAGLEDLCEVRLLGRYRQLCGVQRNLQLVL